MCYNQVFIPIKNRHHDEGDSYKNMIASTVQGKSCILTYVIFIFPTSNKPDNVSRFSQKFQV